MSEVNGEIEKLEEIVRETLLKMFKEKFDGLTSSCSDRVVLSNGNVICTYHKLSPVGCCFSTCPRLDVGHLEKTKGRGA